MKRLCFAFDFDGVIDRYPESVRWLTNLLLHSGHQIHIITGRRKSVDWDITLNQLRKLKIRYTELHLYPGEYEFDGRPLSSEHQQAIGEWKSGMCEEIGATVFFDDQLHAYQTEFPCATVHI
jgi:hypothetical protein